MVVSITWSASEGGTAIPEPLDHGNIANGTQSTAQDLFVRHDGTNPITSVGYYAQAFSGDYAGNGGNASAAADFTELIGWGDNYLATDEGGFLINQNRAGAFPATDSEVHKTGTGDSASNAFTLQATSFTAASTGTTAGQLDSGDESQVNVYIAVPTTENTAGVRLFDQVLKFTFTS
jgi:hypothetical protein